MQKLRASQEFVAGLRTVWVCGLSLFLLACSSGPSNPSAGKSNGSSQVVAAPTITSISPASPKSNQGATVVVNGTNFQKGFRATLSVDTWTGPIPAEALTYVSPTEVRAVIFFGRGGTYTATLTVINPDGGSASIPFTVSN